MRDSAKGDIAITTFTGTICTGVGNFSRLMTTFSDVFERHIGEKLFPGTLNLAIDRKWPARPDIVIPGVELGHHPEDLWIEQCEVNGIAGYRIRPYSPIDGSGGHGDDVLEIAAVDFLRPRLERAERIEITFFR